MTNIGDYYLNTTSGDVFQYQMVDVTPTWVKIGNLKGIQGDTGDKGDKGDTGTAGATWYSGATDPT